MVYSNEQVMAYLPHRDPFLFVDYIESISLLDTKKFYTLEELVGGYVVGFYKTKSDHSIFKGHFPGNPILPGVLQVEIMAQVSAFLVTRMKGDAPLGSYRIEVALLGIDKARFKKPIYPNQTLKIKAKLERFRKFLMQFSAEIEVEGQIVSSCEFSASISFL